MKATNLTFWPVQSIQAKCSELMKSMFRMLDYLLFDILSEQTPDFSAEDPPIIERRSIERRIVDRRKIDRRDEQSWRAQIWKRTSLSQYCRRNNERREETERRDTDRRLSMAMMENQAS